MYGSERYENKRRRALDRDVGDADVYDAKSGARRQAVTERLRRRGRLHFFFFSFWIGTVISRIGHMFSFLRRENKSRVQ